MTPPAGYHRQSFVFQGHSASPGLGIGAAFWCMETPVATLRRKIVRAGVPAELARLRKAYQSAILELYELENKKSPGPQSLKDILAAHRMMLDDSEIRAQIESRIRRNLICAEWAVEETYGDVARVFERMKNHHLSARREDVRDVMRFLLDRLTPGLSDRDWPTTPFIAVAHEFSPAQTAALLSSKVVGMVTRLGGRTSHSAILAREMGIPLVFGLSVKRLNRIRPADTLLVDGATGRVLINPSASTIRNFRRKISALEKLQRVPAGLRPAPARTPDDAEVFLRANIDVEREVSMVKKYGACGVGLFRTEYLYLGMTVPDENTLYRAYRHVSRKVLPDPVVVRTIDIGGDKFMSPIDISADLNPMLGMRAVRLCLAQPQLLMPQLKAALRANTAGNIRLCLPLISAVEEIVRVREHLEEARRELARRRTPHKIPPVGIMVEVPSVAICIDRFLPFADFFSIGTNDLVQYTLAVSRTQEQVAYLYRPLHPAVLSLISRVVSVCTGAGKDVSLCGEEAANPLIIPFLLGIGLRDLSMALPATLDIKKLISGLRVADCRSIAHTMLECSTTDEVERYVRREVYPMVKRIIPLHYTYVSLESEL